MQQLNEDHIVTLAKIRKGAVSEAMKLLPAQAFLFWRSSLKPEPLLPREQNISNCVLSSQLCTGTQKCNFCIGVGKLLHRQIVKQLLLVQERLHFFVEVEQGRCDTSDPIYLSQLLSLPYSLSQLPGDFQEIEAIFCEMGTVT